MFLSSALLVSSTNSHLISEPENRKWYQSQREGQPPDNNVMPLILMEAQNEQQRNQPCEDEAQSS